MNYTQCFAGRKDSDVFVEAKHIFDNFNAYFHARPRVEILGSFWQISLYAPAGSVEPKGKDVFVLSDIRFARPKFVVFTWLQETTVDGVFRVAPPSDEEAWFTHMFSGEMARDLVLGGREEAPGLDLRVLLEPMEAEAADIDLEVPPTAWAAFSISPDPLHDVVELPVGGCEDKGATGSHGQAT